MPPEARDRAEVDRWITKQLLCPLRFSDGLPGGSGTKLLGFTPSAKRSDAGILKPAQAPARLRRREVVADDLLVIAQEDPPLGKGRMAPDDGPSCILVHRINDVRPAQLLVPLG